MTPLPTRSSVQEPSTAPGNTRIRLGLFWITLVVIVLLIFEGGAFITVRFLLSSQIRDMLWEPDLNMVRAAWSRNAESIDDELGWPSAKIATSGTRDPSGAKLNALFPNASEACLSAYGDSFIWGDEVPLAEGWIEQLSRRLGCRVSNYGVSGYGTDQAYLRYRRNTEDKAPVVILGIFPDDIVRNVNQYRAFMGFQLEPFWIKGRFILDDEGNLQWIPRPKLNAETYLELHQTPRAFLPYEYLMPNTRDGPVSVRFPYMLSLLRLALAPRVWSRLRGQTPWADFFGLDHPSGALELTIAISRAFVKEAEGRGARVFIVMMPSAGSFRTWERFGATDYSPFVAAMAANGIDVFDPLPALAKAVGRNNFCKLYAPKSSCHGHFGIAGGSLLSQVVEVELLRRNLISSGKDPKYVIGRPH